MARIAAAHPGKMGDALYALPAIRELSGRIGTKIDFYTSAYCEPLRRLFEAQSCIGRFVVAHDYVLQDFGCGARPWRVPVPPGYDEVFQLGFETGPSTAISDHIAQCVGLPAGLPIRYDYPAAMCEPLEDPYIVSAPRGITAYAPAFREIADRCPVTVVEVGARGDGTGSRGALDKTGLDMLDVLPWLAHARGFVGLQSAMLVLANGFPIPKIAPQGPWDMRHVVRSPLNHYPVALDADAVFRRLGLPMTFCKTLDSSDYDAIHETQHARNIKAMVGTFGGRQEHEHRAWEYGLVLRALRDHGVARVLDVGGGGSNFAPAATWVGMHVTQVDPENYRTWVAHQSRVIKKPITYDQRDFMAYDGGQFDAVACISVLEHIPDDMAFYRKLASHVRVGGLLAITVDFWPDGERKSPDHLRTYNAKRLQDLIASTPGFETVGAMDYADRGPHVYGYTFASLVTKRVA